MDHFATRPQDPYIMTDDQRRFVREKSSLTGKASRWKKHSLRGCLLNPGRFDQYMDPYPISNEQLPARKTQMYAP